MQTVTENVNSRVPLVKEVFFLAIVTEGFNRLRVITLTSSTYRKELVSEKLSRKAFVFINTYETKEDIIK